MLVMIYKPEHDKMIRSSITKKRPSSRPVACECPAPPPHSVSNRAFIDNSKDNING